ncbi:serine protease notopleural [Megachile rotundata]|uniref:serine protease notopleural n=1 Tax=Megachile rotundata TaxID=143995 RepID=UPI003FD408D6
MWDRERTVWAIVFLANVLMNTAIASPIYVAQFIPGSTGRNIRHLPCVSRRTGETGVCMFAFTCAKANGTHLGTCIDRFYFGSCCKIDEEPDIFPQDNSIDDGPPARPFVTTHGPIESYDIPEYFSRPKPINEMKPPGTTLSTEGPSTVTHSTREPPTTIKDTTKLVTKKPILTSVETTTQPVRLSTFQTVQNSSIQDSTTRSPPRITSSTVQTTQKPSSTVTEIMNTTGKPSTLISTVPPRPTTLETATKVPSTAQTFAQTTKPITRKPIVNTSTTKRPTYATTRKPVQSTVNRPTETTLKPVQSSSHQTTESTTSKTVYTTTQRTTPITRFPPRNATTARPLTHATTRRPTTATKRPTTSSSTRRPTTTRKPTSPTKRPSKPSTSTSSTLSFATTTKPTVTTVKDRPSTIKDRPSTIATTTGSSTSETKPTVSVTETTVQKITTSTTKPVQKIKPTTIRTTTSRPTTSRPTTTTSRPTTTTSRPTTTTSKPTKTTSRPTTTPRPKPTRVNATTTKPQTKPAFTTTEKTESSSSIETFNTTVTKVRPTTESTKPTKPFKPLTTPSTVPTVTETSFAVASSTEAYVPSTKVPVNQTLDEAFQTTYAPGIVTWTSSSDDTTKTPEIATTEPDQTESDWTPITTPDGWIMIQSPSTKKPGETQATTEKPISESTLIASTSAKPTTEVTTEQHVATTLSSIASVTIDAELPVPMETLNMSDYKQVCGRRLFPEPRIVGGNRSSFGKWPWQISLRQWRTSTYLHKCGAALLNENWAITAAHCVENVPPSDLLLRIGEHDLANEDEPYGFQERRVQIVASHPQFDPRTFEFDLALLRFYEPLLPFQPNVLPICLPDDDETYVGRTAYVTGWGRLYDEGPLPSTLQEVAVPVINNTMCESMYRNAGYIEHIPHIFICAGWKNGGSDSCEGDSGGPMVIQRARDKRWILAGVISWGIGCAVPNQPGVYTRISEFREWINQILQF